MVALRIRRAEADDLAVVLALYRHLNPADPPLAPAHAASAWATILAHPGNTIFLGFVGSDAVASCTLVVVPNLTRSAAPYGLIENVVTHADHRRRGHGRAVLVAAVAAAKDAGCYKVMLMTGARIEGTLDFYKRAGFKQDKTAFTIRLMPST